MNRKYELLKVKYENARTWLFTLLAVALSTSIGYYTVSDTSFKSNLACITGIAIIGILFFDFLQIIRYIQVIKYLENKK